jgi:hypothetical protein
MPVAHREADRSDVAIRAIRNGWWGVVAGGTILIFALLLLIPPHGILSENEENYFALAERFVDSNAWSPDSAVFDASPHRMLSDATLGTLVSTIGYAPTQMVTRLLAAAGYALALTALFQVFELSALDAALAVMTMALLGQSMLGGEWLFESYEAKVVAYSLVLAGLRLVLVAEGLTGATLLFAAATYFHILVGGFWFVAAVALRLLGGPRELRRVAGATALFALLVAPLAGVIAWSRFTDRSAAMAADLPTPDVIYSIIREPHHQSPFLSLGYFVYGWLPGYVISGAMLAACLWGARHGPTRRLRVAAGWLAGLLAYLFLVLGPKYLDRDSGVLGKFYLFRPASLILLLWLMLALALAFTLLARRGWLLRAALLILIGPAFLLTQGRVVVREMRRQAAIESQKQLLAETVQRRTGPRDVVLIDPELEMGLLDFERRTQRPTWVNWKFTPTNDAEIIEWYRRMLLRRSIFEQGCSADHRGPAIAFLLTTPARAAQLTASCGPEIFRSGQWVLLDRTFMTGAGEP